MAEVVMTHLVAGDAKLSSRIVVSSAGTANWHVGDEMDPRARGALDRAGFTRPGTLAEHATSEYVRRHDLLITMSREQRDDVRHALGDHRVPVIVIRSLLEPEHELDLEDPYYKRDVGFDDCLASLSQSCQELASRLRLGDELFEV